MALTLTSLTEGTHTGKLVIKGNYIDMTFNISATVSATTAINSVTITPETGNEPTFNLSGQRVSPSYRGIVIRNGKKYFNGK